jgi:hypothetical protein
MGQVVAFLYDYTLAYGRFNFGRGFESFVGLFRH